MAPSPVSNRRSYISSSPSRPFAADFLSDDRNTQLSHYEALEAARAEHERVREAAIRVFEMNALEEERKKIEQEQRREQERLQKEQEVIAEQQRLEALRAKTIPKPPPPPKPDPAIQQRKKLPAENQQTNERDPQAKQSAKPTASASSPFEPGANRSPLVSAANGAVTAKSAASSPFAKSSLGQSPFSQSPALKTLPQTNGFGAAFPRSEAPAQQPDKPQPQSQPQQSQGLQAARPATAPVTPAEDLYLRIHQALKGLRKDLVAYSSQPGSPLKGKVGDMRREVRKSMGQLTGTKGANAIPVNKVKSMLRDSLSGAIQSPPVDAQRFVADKRGPMAGARYNDETLPSLFIYLVNIMAKFMINQFASECGASPKAADPIGVVAAQIFSDPDFHWRGKSVIDILLAKFRKECPVAFGVRASDKTAAGRQAIGWRRDGGWMPEQVHYDRMAGLGAGFASVALRDFSKAKKENPYPPSNYWTALAKIVNTPADQVSDTQYIVLKAMIDGHEHRILQFYGNAGMALLRIALVEFPKKAVKSPGAGALRVLGEVLQAEKGLNLA